MSQYTLHSIDEHTLYLRDPNMDQFFFISPLISRHLNYKKVHRMVIRHHSFSSDPSPKLESKLDGLLQFSIKFDLEKQFSFIMKLFLTFTTFVVILGTLLQARQVERSYTDLISGQEFLLQKISYFLK